MMLLMKARSVKTLLRVREPVADAGQWTLHLNLLSHQPLAEGVRVGAGPVHHLPHHGHRLSGGFILQQELWASRLSLLSQFEC